ncbi:1506_t:CDS:2 [Dentiscutata heterogama]|uniref:1506_t:CDS:1 n=1 Tax=Dentiscutata heterogama TaxID=1316150 RepID=A0ACA9LFR5_9GLOM|nr:1506_t:CDS:2 [Dentiscutata heterogama]
MFIQMLPFHHILSQPVVDTNNTENTKNTRTNMQTSLNKPRRLYKFGLRFQETASAIRHALKPPCVCSYCDAKLFSGETGGICCISGKIKLASTEHAASLRDLFMRLDEMGNEFRVNIRAYNSVFAFTLDNVINDDKNEKTMLTEYFKMNEIDPDAKNYLYREFPHYYVWNKANKKWTKRSQRNIIGRMYVVNPNEGEKYYLRLLLSYVRGATSFADLRRVGDYLCATFQESALRHRIIEPENPYNDTMREAAQFQMPYSLRRLFAIILVFGEPGDVRTLWNDNFVNMSEDFVRNGIPSGQCQINAVLLYIKSILEQHHRKLDEFDLPSLNNLSNEQYEEELPRLILEQLSFSYGTC